MRRSSTVFESGLPDPDFPRRARKVVSVPALQVKEECKCKCEHVHEVDDEVDMQQRQQLDRVRIGSSLSLPMITSRTRNPTSSTQNFYFYSFTRTLLCSPGRGLWFTVFLIVSGSAWKLLSGSGYLDRRTICLKPATSSSCPVPQNIAAATPPARPCPAARERLPSMESPAPPPAPLEILANDRGGGQEGPRHS